MQFPASAQATWLWRGVTEIGAVAKLKQCPVSQVQHVVQWVDPMAVCCAIGTTRTRTPQVGAARAPQAPLALGGCLSAARVGGCATSTTAPCTHTGARAHMHSGPWRLSP